MRVEILRGYRGKPTNEQYLVPGEHDLDPALAAYLVDNGHAIALESEPEIEAPKPAQRKTSRKPRKVVTDDGD